MPQYHIPNPRFEWKDYLQEEWYDLYPVSVWQRIQSGKIVYCAPADYCKENVCGRANGHVPE